MTFEAKTLTLKNGCTAVLRPAIEADAEGLLDYLRTAAAETEFLLRTPDECNMSV